MTSIEVAVFKHSARTA